MKISFFYSSFFILIIALTSCKKEFPKDTLAMSDLSISDCKAKGDATERIEPEYITVMTVNDYYILFNHLNSVFNCEPGEIIVSAEVSSNTITIKEDAAKAEANCVYPFDIEFRLGPLGYGNYKIIFQKGGVTFKEYSLTYKRSTVFRIDI